MPTTAGEAFSAMEAKALPISRRVAMLCSSALAAARGKPNTTKINAADNAVLWPLKPFRKVFLSMVASRQTRKYRTLTETDRRKKRPSK
jgi:hypothetical protein